jgi:dihydrofolate reductase
MLSLVVAAADNNAIGKDNKLLWHLPGDMKFFKNITWAMPVIMGRKTFESLGKPLSGRLNVVITSNTNWHPPGVTTASNLQDAIQKAGQMQCHELFVIGGGQIYRDAFDIADRIYLTRVHTSPEADTFFPAVDEHEWELTLRKDIAKNEKHAFDHSFQVWERKGVKDLNITI